MSFLSTLAQRSAWPDETFQFCEDFCRASSEPKYILGRNIYSERVASLLPVSGIVDDYASEGSYMGLPVIKARQVPGNALVLNAAGGRPFTAKAQLDSLGLRNLDYFAFYKVTQLPLLPMRFNEGFEDEVCKNREKYEWVHRLLNESESREIFQKLVQFRFDYDLSHLHGFTDREKFQYFERFLALHADGETFVDVGGYDGYTSAEFVKHCPRYRAIHAFEPDQGNFERCSKTLSSVPNARCYPIGLSNSKGKVRFDISGSASKISEAGAVSIAVDRLDDVLDDHPTFVKMDIEGGESSALEGARNTIAKAHPRLAIAVYHAPGDFWRIPELILGIREDYEIRLRHYTECIYETVMFFLPKK